MKSNQKQLTCPSLLGIKAAAGWDRLSWHRYQSPLTDLLGLEVVRTHWKSINANPTSTKQKPCFIDPNLSEAHISASNYISSELATVFNENKSPGWHCEVSAALSINCEWVQYNALMVSLDNCRGWNLRGSDFSIGIAVYCLFWTTFRTL